MKHESTYRVPYADTDQMQVVYYANYFVYFERSRTDMLRDLGVSYREMEERGFILPVAEAHCKYKNPARYDDLLTFRSWVSEMRGVQLTVTTEVWREGAGLVDLTEGRLTEEDTSLFMYHNYIVAEETSGCEALSSCTLLVSGEVKLACVNREYKLTRLPDFFVEACKKVMENPEGGKV